MQDNGSWWKKPSFSTEQIITILVFLIPILWIGLGIWNDVSTIKRALPKMATKNWVEHMLNQGNELHDDFDERIDALERHRRTPLRPIRPYREAED